MGGPRVIYWFRTDLRLHDSPALKAALDLKPECLYPVWTWDPHYVYRARVGPNRWQFLLECQKDLSQSISKLNKKSQLFLIREGPITLLPKLFKAWKVSHLVFESDTDAYGQERDGEIMKLAKKAGVEVIVKVGRTLYDPNELVRNNDGRPTMSITQVQNAGKKCAAIPRPIPPPTSFPDPGDTSLNFEQEQPKQSPDFNEKQRNKQDSSYEKLSGPKGDFAVPTMEELGLKEATTPHHGGEKIALAMLEKIISDQKYTATFSKPETAPTAFEPQATTLLSPHLHFGSLSVREFYWRVQDIVTSYKGATQPPTSLIGQLLFRDMYFGAQAKLGWQFGQTMGNSHCRFIPWHLQSKTDPRTHRVTNDYYVDSQEAEEWLQRWREGRTGFPWIDALMRQLKREGWIHHLGRHAVACFLTRGGCYISWERGMEVFEEWLLDHEAACNIGNWQWLSCTAFYAMFYRCYSPIAFPQKWDKEGKFVKRYVPELKDYPEKYIYEPWKAPIQVQRQAGCLIKRDGSRSHEDGTPIYPKPMFDFAERRTLCLDAMKKAYSVGLYGNDPKVLDGTWRKLFEDGEVGDTTGNGIKAVDMPTRSTLAGAKQEEDETEGFSSEAADSATRQSEKIEAAGKRKRGQSTLDGHIRKAKK